MNGDTLDKKKKSSSKWTIGIISSIVSIVLGGVSFVGAVVCFVLTVIVGATLSATKNSGGDYSALEAQTNLYSTLMIVLFVLFAVLVTFGIIFLIISIYKKKKTIEKEKTNIVNFQR